MSGIKVNVEHRFVESKRLTSQERIQIATEALVRVVYEGNDKAKEIAQKALDRLNKVVR